MENQMLFGHTRPGLGHRRKQLEQVGPMVNVTYDWKIRGDNPLLRYLSLLLKPIFAANHRWAMAKGEKSLKLELARRRATTPRDAARIPPPP